MERKFTLERMFEVWDDSTGECIEVGPDRDGLDLIEIRVRTKSHGVSDRLTMDKAQAVLVAKALLELTGDPS